MSLFYFNFSLAIFGTMQIVYVIPKLKTIFLSVVLLFFLESHAQTLTALDIEISKAERAFQYKKYHTAANLYQKIYPKIKSEEKQDSILFMIAESYRLSNNFDEAIKWYEKLVNTKYPNPKIIYSYGLLLKNFEQYDEASRKFYDYLFEVPDDANGKREQLACQTALEWKNNPEKFIITNISNLNSPYSDYAPFIVSDKLIWASSRNEATGSVIFEWTGQKCSDLFESEQSDFNFTSFKKLKGNVNTPYNEGVSWVDSSYTTLFFTLCNGRDGKTPGCKIYASYQNDTGWSTPELLPFNSDNYSCGHPSFSRDGKYLYFASDMPGGYGEKDIYRIAYNRTKNTWGTPENLGVNINTTEDELFPFIDENNHLYFSSKGRIGMGGLDVYVSRCVDDKFIQAQNLKYPINSGGDDFGISFIPALSRKADKPIAFFSSNRQGGKGDDDLYSIAIKPFSFVVKTTVIDATSNSIVSNASVIFSDSSGTPIITLRTNTEGKANADLPLNKNLSLIASKEKYLSSSALTVSSYQLTKDSILELVLKIQAIPEADVEFTLEGIFYDLDKYDLRQESKMILDSVALILKNNPNIIIELAAHTDSRAPADYNLTLSQKRAESCVTYLVAKGIKKERLVAKGYGETQLVNDCADEVECTEEEHQQNRRTTIRILSSDFNDNKRR